MLRVLALSLLICMTHCVQVCNKLNSVDISKGVVSSNGVIVYRGVRYTKNEYYYDDTGSIRGCVCKNRICVRKCCPFGLGYDYEKKVCVNVTTKFEETVWNKYRKLDGVHATNKFKFVIGKLNCSEPEFRVRVGEASKHIHMIQDGSLYVDTPNVIPPWTVRDPDSYCIDTFVSEEPDGSKSERTDALVCITETPEDELYVLSSTCMMISCVFILATLVVYAWLPELRNLHGRVLMSYLLCLFVGFSSLTTMQILLIIDNITSNMCVGMTIVIYFSLLAAFFWLNVMCFDIWWTFSGKRELSIQKLSTRDRFRAYAMYAFGIPTALTVLLTALEFSDLPPHPFLPMLRHQGCFIYGTSKLFYLYGPIVILCIANMVFFILTAVKIAQIKQQTAVLKSKESSTHDQHRKDTQRFLLYVKLFAVMGINWFLEVISALYPHDTALARASDINNVLTGVTIFTIFICKRKIYVLLKRRLVLLKPMENVFHVLQ